jgi:two-component system, chemotaxis family, protein-glutamate methylesterase/glutaminase
MSISPIRVLIVDDSAVVRRLVSEALKNDPEIEVVGTAMDPFVARDKIKALKPHVLTLDLEMPRMDGLTFLKILMEQHPLPVIIMSSLTPWGSDAAMEALKLGAFDVLAKPNGSYSFGDLGPQLIARIKGAVTARIRGQKTENRRPTTERTKSGSPFRPTLRPRSSGLRPQNPRDLILLGASTGGTEALREVLTQLPADVPPIAIVQHIPPVFSKTFAERLDQMCNIEVREAVDGERLEPGLALIAPGNFHLMLQWQVDHYRARVVSGPAVWHQRPAVDLLFKSAVDCGAAPHAVAGILTGMGRDGADGLLRLRERGATTFAQDEATSVVYGMPRVAWENGAAMRQLPLEQVADYILRPTDAPRAQSTPPFVAAPA